MPLDYLLKTSLLNTLSPIFSATPSYVGRRDESGWSEAPTGDESGSKAGHLRDGKRKCVVGTRPLFLSTPPIPKIRRSKLGGERACEPIFVSPDQE